MFLWCLCVFRVIFFFSSRRRHTRSLRDWSSDVCSSDLMEIIESLEPTRRALYAGTVGYVDASGDMDMAIAIRTAVLHQGRAYVQAGAGVVADSDPATEEAETRHKARAVLSAIATAEGLRELR